MNVTSMQVSLHYSTFRGILTLLTLRVTDAGNTIPNTVTYRKYNYLQYRRLSLLTKQHSTCITCGTYRYLQYVVLYIDFEEEGVLLNKLFD